MKNIITVILIFFTLHVNAQDVKIEIPETYELSNIILALTEYGITDDWEVQKKTDYYREVLTYFEPVKNHPLLDSVNYSREKWEDYLSFRTDAAAFSFDNDGKLRRDFVFYTNNGHDPFGENLELINDFVLKSNFRHFFREHQDFYNSLIRNYESYNYLDETISFLDANVGKYVATDGAVYKVILSPLVYRMNCHRQLNEYVEADFPSATEDFINGVDNNDMEDRLNSNHLIFTEKDHAYINPITSRYLNLVNSNFDTKYWDKNSGYGGFNSFNEYMTWAVYDLFLDEQFPEYAPKLSTYWQYQNATRGFFAQNLFSDKLKELYRKNNGRAFEYIYEPLLKWAKEVEETITLPTLTNMNTNEFVTTALNNIQLEFSEEMNTQQSFGAEIREFKNGEPTGKTEFVEVTDFKWSNDGRNLNFGIETGFEEFALIFNWWGIEKPLISRTGIFLEPSSYVLLKK